MNDLARPRIWPCRRAAAVAICALTLALSACGGDRSVPPQGPPARIVSLAPSLTEILFALGVGGRVVGVTTYCDHPPEALSLPRVGGFADPSAEAILALEPDLVLVSPAAGNRDAALAVRRAGVRLEVVPADSLEDAFEAIGTVAELCGAPERGRELARSVRARLDEVVSQVHGLSRVRVLFCLQLDPLVAAGRGTLPSQLLELAGGENVVEAERWPRLGIESVLAMAPEVVLQARMDTPAPEAATEAALGFWRRWPALPAVERDRVWVFDGTTSLRAGPRVSEAAEFLARTLHPEAYAPIGSREP